ncbi:tyrosine-type recombinase/integrase [Terasakiella pusilla]|uniref:tyrosine-type recombinase/integrase n=1 Tax=Terasakiella pusilla TaxID=64973 RepID=UPI00048C0A6A|nr:tyrosine-type recombinase/integrase [Terasakiella pusilla]
MRRNLKYVTDRKRPGGYTDYYYRRNGQLQKIIGEPHSDEFMANYARIHASFEDKKSKIRGGFDHLCEEYMKSREFCQLKESSRRQYRLHIDRLRYLFEGVDIHEIDKSVIKDLINGFSDRIGTANNFLRMLKTLFTFAVGMEYLSVSPANGIKPYKGGEYQPWSDDEIELFLNAETTSKEMRRVLLFALYTGQRQGDLINMRWNDLSDGGVNVVQEKTGTKLWIPLHPVLEKIIPKISRDNVNILTSSTNRRWSPSNLRNTFRDMCRKAGVPSHKVFHGLRKSATVKLIEAGCTYDQVKAITGHKTTSMVEHYGKGTNQKRLAKEAMDKFGKSVTSLKKV